MASFLLFCKEMVFCAGAKVMVYGQVKLLNAVSFTVGRVDGHGGKRVQLARLFAHQTDNVTTQSFGCLGSVDNIFGIAGGADGKKGIPFLSQRIHCLGINQSRIFVIQKSS